MGFYKICLFIKRILQWIIAYHTWKLLSHTHVRNFYTTPFFAFTMKHKTIQNDSVVISEFKQHLPRLQSSSVSPPRCLPQVQTMTSPHNQHPTNNTTPCINISCQININHVYPMSTVYRNNKGMQP